MHLWRDRSNRRRHKLARVGLIDRRCETTAVLIDRRSELHPIVACVWQPKTANRRAVRSACIDQSRLRREQIGDSSSIRSTGSDGSPAPLGTLVEKFWQITNPMRRLCAAGSRGRACAAAVSMIPVCRATNYCGAKKQPASPSTADVNRISIFSLDRIGTAPPTICSVPEKGPSARARALAGPNDVRSPAVARAKRFKWHVLSYGRPE